MDCGFRDTDSTLMGPLAKLVAITGRDYVSATCWNKQTNIRQCIVSKKTYFSIGNAHLMYNAHPKIFDIPFDV
jgi:hypothetical protein